MAAECEWIFGGKEIGSRGMMLPEMVRYGGSTVGYDDESMQEDGRRSDSVQD